MNMHPNTQALLRKLAEDVAALTRALEEPTLFSWFEENESDGIIAYVADMVLKECPTDSPCGDVIIKLVQAAMPLLKLVTEPEERDEICRAVASQINVIYLG
jgi:hypothetical protein